MKMEEKLHRFFIESKNSLAIAESCTGGALSFRFTSQPGASCYFQGAVVAYSNDVKRDLLHVDPEILASWGAVSCEVTDLMATNIRKICKTTCGIAVSGILGPSGGTVEKPVGTVCATISYLDKPIHSWTMHHTGSREVILEKTIQAILTELLRIVRK